MSVTGKYGEWAGSCTACPHGETSELGATRCRALTSTDKSLSVQVQRRKWPADPRLHSPALDAKSAQIQRRKWPADPRVHSPALDAKSEQIQRRKWPADPRVHSPALDAKSEQIQRRKWPADPRLHSPALDAKSAQIQPRHWNPDPYAQVHKPAWTTMKWHPKSQQLWHTEPDGH
jgi:hypothetical protein